MRIRRGTSPRNVVRTQMNVELVCLQRALTFKSLFAHIADFLTSSGRGSPHYDCGLRVGLRARLRAQAVVLLLDGRTHFESELHSEAREPFLQQATAPLAHFDRPRVDEPHQILQVAILNIRNADVHFLALLRFEVIKLYHIKLQQFQLT